MSVEFSHLVGKEGTDYLAFFSVCGLCTVCLGLFALSLGVICKLYNVTVALSGYLLCKFCPLS